MTIIDFAKSGLYLDFLLWLFHDYGWLTIDLAKSFDYKLTSMLFLETNYWLVSDFAFYWVSWRTFPRLEVKQHAHIWELLTEKTYETLPEEIKRLEARKEALMQELSEVSAITVLQIKRPAEMSIQDGMGLADNKPRYDVIRVCTWVDLTMAKKKLSII